jgi:plastocyanin
MLLEREQVHCRAVLEDITVSLINKRALLPVGVAAFGIAMLPNCLSADADLVVSQKSRMFHPGSVNLPKGGSLVIVNDDGDLLHHAYVESDSFNFDSGDQQPGTHTRVTFPVAGDFKVLCGIHPKMKLLVHVE